MLHIMPIFTLLRGHHSPARLLVHPRRHGRARIMFILWKHICMYAHRILLEHGDPGRPLYQPDGILVFKRCVQHYLRSYSLHLADSCPEILESAEEAENRANTCLYLGRIVSLSYLPCPRPDVKIDDP
jgi:hypothetical protein